MKHTPEPWKSEHYGMAITAGSNQTLARVYWGEGRSEEENLANARLIAAAPDLYKELKHLVGLLEPLEQEGGLNVPGLATLNGARAALKKVEEVTE